MTIQRRTLCIGELLSKSIGCDGQHPLDPPEQNYIITLQLEHNKKTVSKTLKVLISLSLNSFYNVPKANLKVSVR